MNMVKKRKKAVAASRQLKHPLLLITSIILGIALLSACPNSPKSNPVTYTIKYDENGATSGTASVEQKKQAGKDLTISDKGSLKKTGFQFVGWNSKADGLGAQYAPGDTYSTDAPLLLYAQWTVASPPAAKLEKAASASRRLYRTMILKEEDSIWVTEQNGKDQLGDGTKGDKRIVSYHLNYSGATPAVKTETVTVNTKYAFKTAAELGIIRNEYVLDSWTNKDGSIKYLFFGAISRIIPITKDLDVYAQWTPLISYDANGARGSAPSAYRKLLGTDSFIADKGKLKKSGFLFTGWNSKADGTGTQYAPDDRYSVDAPLLLYAQWAAGVVAVQYNANGAATGTVVPAEQIVKTGQGLTLADNTGSLQRTGYVLGGWNTEANQRGTHYALGATYSETVSRTLYAEWYIAITSVSDLEKIRTDLNENYILQNDIDLSSIANFKPIGGTFRGIFNGEGHTINNLIITRENEKKVGFFREVNGALIYNLQFSQAKVKGKGARDAYDVGGVGVLTGYSYKMNVKRVIVRNSKVTATVFCSGLLIGEADESTIEDCGAEGFVEGGGKTGGLIGGSTSNIRCSYAQGTVTSTGPSVGGLLGDDLGGGIIEECYANVRVSSRNKNIGGLVGWQSADLAIINSYAIGKVSNEGVNTNRIGGLIGLSGDFTSLFNNYFDRTSTGQALGVGSDREIDITSYSTTDLTGTDKFSGWDFAGKNGKPAIWHWVGTGNWPILQWQYELQQATP